MTKSTQRSNRSALETIAEAKRVVRKDLLTKITDVAPIVGITRSGINTDLHAAGMCWGDIIRPDPLVGAKIDLTTARIDRVLDEAFAAAGIPIFLQQRERET